MNKLEQKYTYLKEKNGMVIDVVMLLLAIIVGLTMIMAGMGLIRFAIEGLNELLKSWKGWGIW